MDRRKLTHVFDHVFRAYWAARDWYQEKRPPTYGPYLTVHQYAELKKGPWRKRWDAFFMRHWGWVYRKPDESMVEYFKRGYRAWLFLGYIGDLHQQPKPPKRYLALSILGVLYVLAFPLFPGSAVPGWEYESPMVRMVGESAAPLVFGLYILSGMIVLTICFGLVLPTMLKEFHTALLAGTFWRDMFGPSLSVLKIIGYPVIRAYRYDRRFVLFPVLMFVKSFQFVAPRLQHLGTRYRKRSREQS